MRNLILLTLSALMLSATVPDTWKLVLNGKTLLVTSSENEEKNRITITRSELQKTGSLVISYAEKKPEKGWKRHISVVDSSENELVKRGNSKVSIGNGELKKMVGQGVRTIKIYSWTLPTDPNKAALVRVRRVHLCTIIIS